MHTTREALRVHLRWMLRRDLDEGQVTPLDPDELRWTEEDFRRVLRARNRVGMVAELPDGLVVGQMVYALHKAKLHVLNFAVRPECRRRGVGARMIGKLVDKLSTHRRNWVTADVREGNLGGQLFLRRMGFLAVDVRRGAWDVGEGEEEDAYRFCYALAGFRNGWGCEDACGEQEEQDGR